MTIQISNDKNIGGKEKFVAFVNGTIANELARVSDRITRVEVRLLDENGSKTGRNVKRCMIEARLKNKQPFAVASRAKTVEKAVNNALDKLKTSMEKTFSRLKNH